MRRSLFALTLLALAPAVASADGVLEINHTCALQTGCFQGDSPGYPVTIDGSAGRSYRLTSDLPVPTADTTGLLLSGNDIAIDLNGFSIIRSACSAATLDCTPISGTGSAIDRASTANRGLSVHDGSVMGMGLFGVRLGEQAEVRNVRARWNRLDGISVSVGGLVVGNTSFQNGRHGISTSTGGTVRDNTLYDNGEDGVNVGTGTTISDNTIYANGAEGVRSAGGSTISDNSVGQNGGAGISSGFGSLVSDNTVYSNADGGIVTGSGALVQRNVLRDNAVYGIAAGNDAVCRDNAISSPFAGPATLSCDVNGGGNYCNGTSVCP
jgi:hypothetical protein